SVNTKVGVAIGSFVLDLRALFDAIGAPEGTQNIIGGDMGSLMWRGRHLLRETRRFISKLLRHDNPTLRDNAELRQRVLIPMREVKMDLPCHIPNYTDFYSSREHATNVGIMMRGKDNALMPNWTHLPVAYHGRASSIVVSGTDVRRPYGQTKA